MKYALQDYSTIPTTASDVTTDYCIITFLHPLLPITTKCHYYRMRITTITTITTHYLLGQLGDVHDLVTIVPSLWLETPNLVAFCQHIALYKICIDELFPFRSGTSAQLCKFRENLGNTKRKRQQK
jgi:hypothetical protein